MPKPGAARPRWLDEATIEALSPVRPASRPEAEDLVWAFAVAHERLAHLGLHLLG